MTNSQLTQTIAAAAAAGLDADQIAKLILSLQGGQHVEPETSPMDGHDDQTLATTYEVLPEDEPIEPPKPRRVAKARKPKAAKARDGRLPEAGTVIERAYRGSVIRVHIGEDQVWLVGSPETKYGSLSSLGKAVTGNETNGYRFFGLNGQPVPTQPKAPKARKTKQPKAPKPVVFEAASLDTVTIDRSVAIAAGMLVREKRAAAAARAGTGTAKAERARQGQMMMLDFISQSIDGSL
jgi:hypothetical protein